MKHGRAAMRQEIGLAIWRGEFLRRGELIKRSPFGAHHLGLAIKEGGWVTDTPPSSNKVKGWARGPCLECWRVLPRAQIIDAEGYRCEACAAHARWHREIALKGIDIKAEREASRKRLAENPERRKAIRGRTPNVNGYYRGSGGTE